MNHKAKPINTSPTTPEFPNSPSQSDALIALGLEFGTMLVNVVETRTSLEDRCQQREVFLSAAITQAAKWDAEMQRRHETFQETLTLASRLIEHGHTAEAVELVSKAFGLFPTIESNPSLFQLLASNREEELG